MLRTVLRTLRSSAIVRPRGYGDLVAGAGAAGGRRQLRRSAERVSRVGKLGVWEDVLPVWNRPSRRDVLSAGPLSFTVDLREAES